MTPGIGADIEHDGIGQLRFGMPSAAWRVPPAFGTHILKVVRLTTKEQVGRIDTTGVVAAMADNEIGWNWACGELVCHAVGKHDAPVTTGDLAVATLLGRCKP